LTFFSHSCIGYLTDVFGKENIAKFLNVLSRVNLKSWRALGENV